MSVESMARVLQLEGLKPIDKLLLVGIANHDGDGGAWPSLATLARYLGKSERTTQYVLQRLVAQGLVTVERNAGGNTRTRNDRRPNLYHLHLSTTPGQRGATFDNGVQESESTGCNEVAPEPSLEPSSIASVENSTAVEPEPAKISLADYIAAHPDVAPRVARWQWAKQK